MKNSDRMLTKSVTPVEVFLSLFSEEFISKLVYQTNLYAIQKNGGSRPTMFSAAAVWG